LIEENGVGGETCCCIVFPAIAILLVQCKIVAGDLPGLLIIIVALGCPWAKGVLLYGLLTGGKVYPGYSFVPFCPGGLACCWLWWPEEGTAVWVLVCPMGANGLQL